MPLSREQMRTVIEAYILARTWESKKRVVQKRGNILLSDEFDQMAASVIQEMRVAGVNSDLLEQILSVLRRCRAVGIDAAFASLLPLDTPEQRVQQAVMYFIDWSLQDAYELTREQPDILLSDSALVLFDRFAIERSNDPDLCPKIQERKALILRARAIGIDGAFAEKEEREQLTINAISVLIQAGHRGESKSAWQESKRVVEQNATLLLTDYADQLLGNYLRNKQAELERERPDPLMRLHVLYPVTEKRELLKRCRERGVEAAFEEYSHMLAEDWSNEFLNFVSTTERAADNWVVIKNFLQGEYAGLFTAQAERALVGAGWLQLTTDMGNKLTFEKLFNRIREQGIDAAFTDLIEFGTDVPFSARDALRTAKNAKQCYEETGDRMSLDVATPAWEAVIINPEFASSSMYTQHTLLIEAANTYEDRYNERRNLPDLDRAIELWQLAANKGEGHKKTPEYQEYLNYLGHSFHRRFTEMDEREKRKDLKKAIKYLDQALQYYREAYDVGKEEASGPGPAPMLMPEGSGPDASGELMWRIKQVAMYLNNIGRAYFERYQYTQDQHDLDGAIEYYGRAADWAKEQEMVAPFLYDDLGNALSVRYWNIKEDTDLETAITAFEQALVLSEQDARPSFQLDAANHYGYLLYGVGRYPEARRVLEKAHQAVGRTRVEQTSQRSRLNLARYNANLYATLVSCCLYEGDVCAAFEYASSGKGRTFVDMLAESRFDLTEVKPDQAELYADLQPYLKLREQIDDVRIVLMQRSMPVRPGEQRPYSQYSEGKLIAMLNDLQREEKTLWDDLVSRYNALAALADIPPLTANAARVLSQELQATLVEYYRHQDGWCAFVVTPDDVQYIPLPLLGDNLLNRMALWVNAMSSFNGGNEPDDKPLAEWYTAVIAPLNQVLSTDRTNILAPFGGLHLLPFYAGLNPETGHYVVDDYLLEFAPCLSALAVIWKRAYDLVNITGQIENVLSVAYPGLAGHPHFLPNVIPEAQVVVDCFPQAQKTVLFGDQATPDAVIAKSYGQNIIHLGCHGIFDPKFPSQSGLLLSEGWLTVQRIITELKLDKARLFTMSACVSARSDLDTGDELIGLTQAAFAAGAQTVVSSLWSVDDAATRELLTAFYTNITDGFTPVQAMRHAVLTLRTQKNRKNPYFWAPFVVSGLGHIGWQIER